MTTQHVCDECKEIKVTPFVVHENNTGRSYDICSSACYSRHVQRMRDEGS